MTTCGLDDEGEGRASWFKSVNWRARIPVLVDGDSDADRVRRHRALHRREVFTVRCFLPICVAAPEAHRWTFYALTELEPHLWAIAQHRFAPPE